MGIQINGQTDTISASDGGLSVSGMELSSVTSINASGIGTFSNGPVLIGSATSTGTATQRLQVTGGAYVSGSIGLGTTNPVSKLHIQDGSDGLRISATAVEQTSSSGLTLNGSNASGFVAFRVAGDERARVTSTGNVQIANGNLVFSTAGTGIDFSATANSSGSMTSELLNDYEVGTWTPTLPNGGTLSVTSALYTKIGNLVYLYFYVSNVQPTNNASEFRFGGLPFTCSTATHYPSGSIGYVGSSNFTGWAPLVNNGDTFVYFHFTNGTNGGARAANSQWVSVNNNGPMIITISYQTAS